MSSIPSDSEARKRARRAHQEFHYYARRSNYMRFNPPPAGGRGADGKPMKPDNSAAGDPPVSGPGTPEPSTARPDAGHSADEDAGRNPTP